MAKIPYGTYDVTIENLMLKKKEETGKPVVSCDMEIAAGKFKGKHFSVEQAVTNGFQIYRVNAFLRALCAEMGAAVKVEFKTYPQYCDLLFDIYDAFEGRSCRMLFSDKGYEVAGRVLCP